MTSELGVFIPGGKTGILLLHDMGGAAADLRPLAQTLARAGHTVSCPQLGNHLDGHLDRGGKGGANGPGLWLSEADLALSRLKARCDNVIVLGCAYGAMLALELVRSRADSVQALVLVEPRAWLPGVAGRIATALAGSVPQVWLARIAALAPRGRGPAAAPAALLAAQGGATIGAGVPAGLLLNGIALLLDSVHGALASITHPVLLIQPQAARRSGLGSSILLQRKLGGRVESVALDDGIPAATAEHRAQTLADAVAERCQRFAAAVNEEIETRRSNELRRQRTAARSSAA